MDVEELAVAMWKGESAGISSAKDLVKFGCKELTNMCKGSRKPLSAERRKGKEGTAGRHLRPAGSATCDRTGCKTWKKLKPDGDAESRRFRRGDAEMAEEMETPEEMEALMQSRVTEREASELDPTGGMSGAELDVLATVRYDIKLT